MRDGGCGGELGKGTGTGKGVGAAMTCASRCRVIAPRDAVVAPRLMRLADQTSSCIDAQHDIYTAEHRTLASRDTPHNAPSIARIRCISRGRATA